MSNKERLQFIKQNNYGIKNLKTWDTEDGGGYQGTITIGGKPAFCFHDDGNGGEMRISNKSDLYERAKTDSLLLLDDDSVEYNQRTGGKFAIEMLAAAVMDFHELRKICKKNTVIELSEDDDQYTVYKKPYSTAFSERLRREHGENLIFIVNEVI